MDEVNHNLKHNLGPCEGNVQKCANPDCPKWGTLGKPARSDDKRRVRGCADPVARGKRNKQKGSRKQVKARKALAVPYSSSLAPGHEEWFAGTLLVEVKAGKQCGPVMTRYGLSEAQAEASRSIGDHRPFAAVFMPDGVSYGLLVVRTDRLEDVVAALYEQLGLGAA